MLLKKYLNVLYDVPKVVCYIQDSEREQGKCKNKKASTQRKDFKNMKKMNTRRSG